MTQGYQALTEKEKQTLRLLVSGYDAKSMARQLGLSVHTVNERLRDARRKMAVSSSREAARMVREAEAQTPQSLGDKGLGDASDVRVGNEGSHHETPDRSTWRTGWIIGGIIMSLVLAVLSYAALSGGSQTAAQPQSVAATQSDAAAAAQRFMALLDAGDWAGSYGATSAALQSNNTAAAWAAVQEKVRTPLGAVRKRQLIADDYVPTPVGYQLIKFRTDYAHKPGVIETLSLAKEGGEWKLVGIIID